MPISSYVLRTDQEDQSPTIAALTDLPWVTIGDPMENGIPVVIESKTEEEAKSLGETLADIPGVSTAVLVYHNFEDLDSNT